MKRKNIFHTLALAALALPMTISMGSCTEEDIIDNYGSVLIDSTYFMYDLNNLLEDMEGTDVLNVYVYELTNKKCLKMLSIQKQTGVVSLTNNKSNTFNTGNGKIDWNEWNLKGDSVIITNSGGYNFDDDRTHFCFGAGVFRTVAFYNYTNDEGYTMDLPSLTEVLKDPTYETLRNANFTYIPKMTGDISGVAQLPWWSWEDCNEYLNGDGENAPFVTQHMYVSDEGMKSKLVCGGLSYDTLEVGHHKTIKLKKIQATREYQLDVQIQKADDLDDFVLDAVYGIVSGVPMSMNYYYETYDVENSAKLAFVFNQKEKDSPANKTIELESVVGVTNLSYGTDTVATTTTNGPGVLQFMVRGWKGSTEIKFTALCNVSKSIINSGIIRKDEDGWRWGGSTTLPIKISTKITADMLEKARKGETIIWRD